jgi:hypothetical protein
MSYEGGCGPSDPPATESGSSSHNELRLPDRDPARESAPIEPQRRLSGTGAAALLEAMKRLPPEVKAAIVNFLEAVDSREEKSDG